MNFRKHQGAGRDWAAKIANAGEAWPHKVTGALICQGGGKTTLAAVFAHELVRRGYVDHVLYICPNSTLRTQVAREFAAPALGLTGELQSVTGSPTGQRSLLRSARMGYVTTYQSVAQHAKSWTRILKDGRWLIVLDECHHLPEPVDSMEEPSYFDDESFAREARWTSQSRIVIEAAKHVLAMTGSAKREIGKIAFLRHKGVRPDFDIVYSRRDALAEKSIINIMTFLCDGTSSWKARGPREVKLSAATAKVVAAALRNALEDPVYRDALLSEAIRSWEDYRHRHNDRARMLVICKDVKACRAVCRYIADHHGKGLAVLAVGETGKDEMKGAKAIDRFREPHREGKILVTCKMAHEGLDIQDCKYLVYLTNVTSRVHMEQAFSRPTRLDKRSDLSWDQQCAYIYAPMVPAIVEFLDEWMEEQDPAFVEPRPRVAKIGERPRSASFEPGTCEPGIVLVGDNEGLYPLEDQRCLRELRASEKYADVARSLRPDQLLLVARGIFGKRTGT